MSIPTRRGWVDTPSDRSVGAPFEQVTGWIAVQDVGQTLSACWGNTSFPIARQTRPDLLGRAHIGYAIYLDLCECIANGQSLDAAELQLSVYGDADLLDEIPLSVDPALEAACHDLIADRMDKRAFLRDVLRSPGSFEHGTRAPTWLPPSWGLSPRIEDKRDAVSSHGYGPAVNEFLDSLGKDSFVLDAGAGLRRYPRRHVVNMEIFDYPSTDIIAVGQDLPFKDDTFDAVLSLAVLEHVDDPFRCAAEIIRVLKPGGKVLAMVPFMQAEHGYPSHYFNMTRFGLRKIFESIELDQHFLEISNHPVHTLHQVLGLYALGLPEDARAKFLDLPVRYFVENDPYALLADKHDVTSRLSAEAAWQVAAGTTAVFTKRG